jgi:hypothetical protein
MMGLDGHWSSQLRHQTNHGFHFFPPCIQQSTDPHNTSEYIVRRRIFLLFCFVCILFNTAYLPQLRFHCVSEDAEIAPRTVATFPLAVRHTNHSVKSHPQISSTLPTICPTVDQCSKHGESLLFLPERDMKGMRVRDLLQQLQVTQVELMRAYQVTLLYRE